MSLIDSARARTGPSFADRPAVSPTLILDRLISFDTSNPPGRETDAAAYLASLLEDYGFTTERPVVGPGRVNVVATLANGAGPVMAFNTHMDVVPAGEGWTRDPFRLTRGDGLLYGRGACDAKGPLAAMAAAGISLALDRARWSGTLQLVFVADEEVGSAGARAFAAGRPHIDYAIIGEPTANGVAIAHKGSLRPLIRIKGRSAHSSRPQDGINAIFGAMHMLSLIENAAPAIALRTHPLCGASSFTVTRIHGGHADNVIPETCDILVDRRVTPGEDEAAVKAEIQALVNRAKTDFGVEAAIAEWCPTTGGATQTPADAPIVVAALAVAARYGVNDPPKGLGGACDLVHFNGVGASGIVLGPGNMGVAHKPDEYVPENQLLAAAKIYEEIAAAMLKP